MYEQFFGMTHTPFTRDVPPEALFLNYYHLFSVCGTDATVAAEGFLASAVPQDP